MPDEVRKCACPCKKPLVGRRRNAKYWDPGRCKQRAYRARVKAQAVEQNVPSSLSFSALETLASSNGPGNRNGDARTRRRKRTACPRPGVQTYFPPGQAEQALAALSDVPELAEVRATLSAAIERRDRRLKTAGPRP